MDKRIIWFAVIILLVVGVIVYFKTCRTKPPVPAGIKEQLIFTIDKSEIKAKVDSIYYEDKTPGATAWYWDFGDSSSSIQQKGYHVYYEPGDFTIKLTINGITDESKYVIVSGDKIIKGRVILKGPPSVYEGETHTYEDITPGAKHTDWLNMDTYVRKKDSKTFTVTFSNVREYTISATNDVSDVEGTIKVNVIKKQDPVIKKDDEVKKLDPVIKKDDGVKKVEKMKEEVVLQSPSNEELTAWFNTIIAHRNEPLSKYTRPMRDRVRDIDAIPVKLINKGSATQMNKNVGDFNSNIGFRSNPKVLKAVADWDQANGFKGITITIEEK